MVGNLTIQGQIVGTATFDGAKISAVVTIAPPINATVVFGRSGVTVHNQLTDRDADDVHPVEAISSPINDSSNVYEWIRSTLLTGLAAFTDAVIVSTDTILSAFAKLQGQLNAIKVRLGLLENNVVAAVTTSSEVAFVEFLVSVSENKWLNFSIKTGSIAVGTLFRIHVNDVTNGYYSTGTGASLSILASMGGDTYNAHQGKMFIGSGFVSYQGLTVQKTGAANPTAVPFNGGHNSITTPIIKIKIFPVSGLIPIGTSFVISK